MSDIAKLGFSVDTQGLKKGEKALDDFAKTGERTEKRTDKSSKKIIDDFEGIEKAVGRTAAEQMKADKAMAQFSRRSGQAGIQFQQFIGQVQGGQGVMLALSQQSADLGFVLGAPLIGAIAGISASLIGLLIPNLIDTTSAMEDLDKAMEQLNKTATDVDGIKAFTKEIAAIAEESEKAGRLMILAAEQSSREAGRAAAEGISEEFNDAFDVAFFQTSFDALKTIAGTAGGTGFTISAEYRELGEQFGLTGVAAREAGIDVLVSLRDMEMAVSAGLPDAGDKIVAFQEKLSELAETSSGENKTKLLTFVNSISEYVSKAKIAAEMSELFNDTLKETDLDLVTEETIKLDSAVEGVANSLEAQIIALRDGEDAAINWSIAQRLGLESVEDIPEAIQAQIEQIKALKIARDDDLELMKEIREEEKLLAAQQKKNQADAEKQMKKREKDFEKLTKQIKGFGGAWTKTGSIIVDTFGDIADAMTDYMDRMDQIEANEKSLAEFRKEKGEDNAEVIALQQKLEEDRVSAELSGIKSLAKAGESLFAEKTAAAKAFAALNKIITVAEIALSFQKMAASTAETTVHVANETTKQGANALTAITSAFAAPFPVNFVAGAAMIGIMASLLGGAFGGGSGSVDMTEQRQETQGTGTVLGSDDKSQSILESQERFEDLSIDQLAELRGIKTSIDSMVLGIQKLTGSIVVSGVGEFAGETGEISRSFAGFSSTKKKILDQGISFIGQSLGSIIEGGILQAQAFFDIETTKKSFFGLKKKVRTRTEFQDIDTAIQQEMAAIFGHIGDTVLESARLLGFETVTIMQQSFTGSDFLNNLDEMDISELKRFMGGRFGEAFGSVFTEVEVGLEEALSQFQINIGKVSLEGLSGEEIEAELQAVFSQQADLIAEFLVPSIAEYQQVGEGLFDTLTRVTKEQVVFNDNIAKMGFDLSELSNVIQIDIAQSIIQLTGGLENFSDLTTSFFENFFSEAEQLAFLENSLTEAFESLGLSIVTSREEFKALVEGIDITTEEGQELLAALLEINPALSDYIEELERVEAKRVDMTIELLRLQGKAEEALAMERQLELEALDESLRALQLLIFAEEDRIALLKEQEDAIRSSFSMLEQAINLEKQRAQASLDAASAAHTAELDRIDGLRSELEAENALRQGNLATAENALNKAFDSEMKRIQDGASAEIALIQRNSNERVNSLNSEKNAIKATATSMKSLVNTINSSLGLSGSSNLIAALASARSGDFSKAKALDISGLTKLDPSEFSSAEELAVQEALNKNRLKAIGDLAQTELTSAEAMLAAIDRQVEATKSSTERQVQAIQEEADLQVKELQEQLNALLGIDDSVLGIDEAIKQFQDAQKAIDELGYEQEVERLDMLVQSANDVFALHEQAYADELERLDAILVDNEELLNAALGIDASVLSVAEAIAALNASISALGSSSNSETTNPVVNPFAPVDDQNIPVAPPKGLIFIDDPKPSPEQEEIKEELRKTREDNVMFQRELIKNTKQTARILQRFELDGLDTRQIP